MNALLRPEPETDMAFWTWREEAGMTHVPTAILHAAWEAGRADLRVEARTDADMVVRFGLQDACLTPRETQLVGALARLGGQDSHPVHVDTLIEELVGEWRLTPKADRHNVRVLVSRLRFKAERFGVCIGTIYNHGYRLHRATQGELCRPPYRNKKWGHICVPLCRRVPS